MSDGMNDTSQTTPAQQRLLSLVMVLFFAWGFCTVLVDTLVPKLKAVFELTYLEVMLTQFSFFIAYFIVSIPASGLLSRVGYLRGLTIGLLVMAGGCLMFAPAASFGLYPAFLAALFVLASGITLLQVAANPLAANLGDPARSHSRLNLAQAFNSVGTMLGPLFGSALILASGVVAAPIAGSISDEALAAFRREEAQVLQLPFMIIAGTLLLLALVFWLRRKMPAPPLELDQGGGYGRVLKRPRVTFGALSIFLYVGAEVSIGSLIASFLMLGSTIGVSAHSAGNMISIYWGLAMVGRFIGAYALRRVPAGAALCACAIAAALLASGATTLTGTAAAVAVLGIGLFNSIMFPTIFTLSIENLGADSASGSGLLCLAIVGGAIVPLVTGFVADSAGLPLAFAVPAVCYVCIATYGALTRTRVLG